MGLNLHAYFCKFQRKITRSSQTLNRLSNSNLQAPSVPPLLASRYNVAHLLTIP